MLLSVTHTLTYLPSIFQTNALPCCLSRRFAMYILYINGYTLKEIFGVFREAHTKSSLFLSFPFFLSCVSVLFLSVLVEALTLLSFNMYEIYKYACVCVCVCLYHSESMHFFHTTIIVIVVVVVVAVLCI